MHGREENSRQGDCDTGPVKAAEGPAHYVENYAKAFEKAVKKNGYKKR